MSKKYNWETVLKQAFELIDRGTRPTFTDLAEELGIPRSTFQDGLKTVGIKSTVDLINRTTQELDGQTTIERTDNTWNISTSSDEPLTEEQVAERFQIDTKKWQLVKFRVKIGKAYRKDRSVRWRVQDGVVVDGDVNDSGELLIKPLYLIEAHYERNPDLSLLSDIHDQLISEIKEYSFHYPTIRQPTPRKKLMVELALPDVHFGRLTWDQETGENYDINIAAEHVWKTITTFASLAKSQRVERIALMIGSDLFNVNSKENKTVVGTPQDEDTRSVKTFRKAFSLMRDSIEHLITIANVDVIVIPGNHDEERSFYLGEVLSAWFRNCNQVSFDNSPSPRKYYLWGRCLLGFTHGHEEKIDRLPGIMAVERKTDWGKTKWREFHIAHKHNQKAYPPLEIDENLGVVTRIIRSLASPDAWTNRKGFVGAVRGAEAFLWHKDDGLLSHHYINSRV